MSERVCVCVWERDWVIDCAYEREREREREYLFNPHWLSFSQIDPAGIERHTKSEHLWPLPQEVSAQNVFSLTGVHVLLKHVWAAPQLEEEEQPSPSDINKLELNPKTALHL